MHAPHRSCAGTQSLVRRAASLVVSGEEASLREAVSTLEHAKARRVLRVISYVSELSTARAHGRTPVAPQAHERSESGRVAHSLASIAGPAFVDASCVCPPAVEPLNAELILALAYLQLNDPDSAASSLEQTLAQPCTRSCARRSMLLCCKLLLSECLFLCNRPHDACAHAYDAQHFLASSFAEHSAALFVHAKAQLCADEVHSAMSLLHECRSTMQHVQPSTTAAPPEPPSWSAISALEARATCSLGNHSKAVNAAIHSYTLAQSPEQRNAALSTFAAVQSKSGKPSIACMLLRKAINEPNEEQGECKQRFLDALADLMLRLKHLEESERLFANGPNVWHKERAAEAAMFQAADSGQALIDQPFGGGPWRQLKLIIKPHLTRDPTKLSALHRARGYLDEAWQMHGRRAASSTGQEPTTKVALRAMDAYVSLMLGKYQRVLECARAVSEDPSVFDEIRSAASVHAATALVATGEPSDAREELNAFLSANYRLSLRENRQLACTLAALHAFCGDLQLARDIALHVLRQAPEERSACITAIFCYNALGNTRSAYAVAMQEPEQHSHLGTESAHAPPVLGRR